MSYLLVTALALVLTAPITAQNFSLSRFKVVDIPGNVYYTAVYGINAAGEMVGTFGDDDGDHGFVLKGEKHTTIDYPGAVWTEAWGINAKGVIVGQYGLLNNTVHGFILEDGNYFPLDVFGQPNTMPVKINERGTIVGCYHESTPSGGIIVNSMFGFTLDGQAMTPQPMARTMNNGINSSGDIVGIYSDPTLNVFRNSYVIKGGVESWFTFPGSLVTQAWDISERGEIVGFYRDASSRFHGFVLNDSGILAIDVDVPGVIQTRAYGINAAGDIVGYFIDATGIHGFVYTRRGTKF